jgi:hypothetical protein
MILADARTGQEVDPIVVDRATGRQLDGEDFVFTAGPAASPAMRARYTPAAPRLRPAAGNSAASAWCAKFPPADLDEEVWSLADPVRSYVGIRQLPTRLQEPKRRKRFHLIAAPSWDRRAG